MPPSICPCPGQPCCCLPLGEVLDHLSAQTSQLTTSSWPPEAPFLSGAPVQAAAQRRKCDAGGHPLPAQPHLNSRHGVCRLHLVLGTHEGRNAQAHSQATSLPRRAPAHQLTLAVQAVVPDGGPAKAAVQPEDPTLHLLQPAVAPPAGDGTVSVPCTVEETLSGGACLGHLGLGALPAAERAAALCGARPVQLGLGALPAL